MSDERHLLETPSHTSLEPVRRATAACGLTFAVLMVLGTVLTTTGPLPNGQVEAEAARVAAEGGALRVGGVLGLFATLSFTGFALGVAAIAMYRRAVTAAAVTAGAGLVFAAVWTVSFASVVASAQAAQTGLAADATMVMGHLHSVTLLAGFVPAGAVLLGSAAARLWGRVLTAVTVVLGAAALTVSLTLLSVDLDMGPFGLAVFASFFGIPLWVLAAATSLLRHRPRPSAGARPPAPRAPVHR